MVGLARIIITTIQQVSAVKHKILAEQNFGKFGKWYIIRQY